MARKFGDYIHLHLNNYYDFGTDRKGSSSDFNSQLFLQHHNQLRTLIEKQKIPNLEELQETYNRQNESAWKMFAKLDKNKNKSKESRAALKYLLGQINSTWTDDFKDTILNGLSWDANKNTFVFNPPSEFNSKYKKTNISALPALKLQDAGFHYIQTLLNYIDRFDKYLSSLNSDEVKEDKEWLQKQKKDLQDVKNQMNALELTEQKIYGKVNDEYKIMFQQKKQSLDDEFFNKRVEEFKERREKYIGAEEINKQIQSSMAEIFGNIVAVDSAKVGLDEIKKAIEEAISVGRAGSTSINDLNSISLSSLAIDDLELTESSFVKKTGEFGKYWKYDFSEIGSSKAQKRDVVLTIDDKEYGISVKNTQFANAFAKDQNNKVPASSISLQNSSLLLYLMGMEKDPSASGIPNIGTHYLNALTQHPEGFDANIQQDALDSLKLYLLYSSMTGRGQLRSDMNSASVLAIYDKASSKNQAVQRIKLFDMSQILLILDNINFEQGVHFSPEIDSRFLLKNDKVISKKTDSLGAMVQQRLTNVLLEARQKNIAVSLYTAFLRDKII